MSTVTLIEAVWTALALAGLLTQLWAISDSFADRRALLLAGARNGRRRLVNGHIRAALVFCLIHLLFVFAGTSALLQPDRPLNLGRSLTIAALIVAALLLVGNGLLDRRDRRILRTKGAP